MKKRVDLNCDLGEWKKDSSRENDRKIMPFISSCNIACGGHIGDKHSISETLKLASDHGVAVGAHPSYPDKENFGRKVLDWNKAKLKPALREQLELFLECCEKEGMKIHHLKPHGALYNHAGVHEFTAEAIVELMLELIPEVPLYTQFGSLLAIFAFQKGLKIVPEAFADRCYEDDLRLRNRSLEGAVIHSESAVLNQIDEMVLKEQVISYSGKQLPINFETICLHSDTEGSIELAKAINQRIRSHGIQISSI